MIMNRNVYLDKLHACWLGKNIGGTLGAPYEGKREFMDISDFSTPGGNPLPNDDLDLQLVWLIAMENTGPENFSTNILAEYWLNYIIPHWNEYGIAKTNLRLGLLPPMSGEVDNEKWKTSNGAWIRSEIWAGLAPGVVDVAVKYAVCDAMVDHGISEGTYAEIFTATIQSAAYLCSDIRTLINIALEKIPADSLLAQTIRLAIQCYDNSVNFREARDAIVTFTQQLGWFQAPNNIGFVILALLYGEGDFKKSVLYAVNCGDDTDCTAATVGATLGIIGGTAAIPDKWKSFIGDHIATVCISPMYTHRIPKTCSELTDRIASLVPSIMRANHIAFAFSDMPQEPTELPAQYNRLHASDFCCVSPFSYEVTHYQPFRVRVELDQPPRVNPGERRQVTLTFFCGPHVRESRKLALRLLLPDTWSCESYQKTVSLLYPLPIHGLFGDASVSFSICIGEKVEAINRAYVEVTDSSLPYPAIIPIVMIG